MPCCAGIGCTPMVGVIKDIVFKHAEDEVGRDLPDWLGLSLICLHNSGTTATSRASEEPQGHRPTMPLLLRHTRS